MAALRLGVALLALITVALGDEDAVLLQARPKASAELSEGMAATKAGIVEKTEHLAEAMKSLEDESEAALKKDYEDVVEMYEADVEKDLNADTKHASLAEGGEGLAAAKAGILAKTHDLAQAMESLNSEDLPSMRKDFEDVFAMYKEDVKKDLKTHAGIEKHASLEGLAAMKSKVISTTEQFEKAMESLNTEDKGALKTDFKDVFKLFKDDLRKITGGDAKPSDEDEDESKDEDEDEEHGHDTEDDEEEGQQEPDHDDSVRDLLGRHSARKRGPMCRGSCKCTNGKATIPGNCGIHPNCACYCPNLQVASDSCSA